MMQHSKQHGNLRMKPLQRISNPFKSISEFLIHVTYSVRNMAGGQSLKIRPMIKILYLRFFLYYIFPEVKSVINHQLLHILTITTMEQCHLLQVRDYKSGSLQIFAHFIITETQ